MYWKLRAKHGLCRAHLLRDLADVAIVVTQTAWAAGLGALLVEINAVCDDALALIVAFGVEIRRKGLEQITAEELVGTKELA